MTKMLQKTENVAKNVANENSQDLIELWRKGELPSRDDDHLWLAYYIKHKDGYIHADSLWRGHWGIADRNSIKEILAPVPSYEKWQAKLEENAQLKELLKSAVSWLDLGWLPDASKFRGGRYAQLQNLKRKIHEALK